MREKAKHDKQTANLSPASTGETTFVAQANPLTRPDFIAAGVAALIALLIYLRTLAPTITGDDSGEFVAAAYTLGICHPPGYPLWTMLGKLFTIFAFPVGSIAARVAFVSSFFGAATCFVVALIVIKLTANRLAGVAAAVALAVSAEFWKWNVVAETYSLNAFLMVLGFLFLLHWRDTRQDKFLYAFGVAYGLGLCNHHTMHFLGPMFALFILSVDYFERGGTDLPLNESPRSKKKSPNAAAQKGATGIAYLFSRWPAYTQLVAIAFGVWLLIHLYLPIRAMADPYVNFGNIYTFENFWAHITRKQYKGGFVADPRTVERFIMQCWAFAKQYGWQFTPFMAWLPLLGIYPLWKRDRRALVFVLGTFVYVALGLILIINTNLDRGSIWLNSKFWVPAYVMAAILIGVGLHWLSTLKQGKPVAAVVAVAVIALPFFYHYNANDKSDYYFTYDLAQNFDKTLEPNAYFFPSSDHAAFAIYYLQAVEKRRLDITIATKYGGIIDSINEILPVELQRWPKDGLPDLDKVPIGSWLVHNTGRPVYFSGNCGTAKFHNAKTIDTGILARMVPPDFVPTERDYFSEYTWHTLDQGVTHGDFTADSILSDYHFAQARLLLSQEKIEEAKKEIDLAIEIAGDHTALLISIGTGCGEYNLTDLAKQCFRKALDINPRDRKAWRNLAVACASTNDYKGAAVAFEKVLQLNEQKYGRHHPTIAASLTNLGGSLFSINDLDGAYRCFNRALRIDKDIFGPVHEFTARDQNNLAMVLYKQGHTEDAQANQTQAIESLTQVLGPDHPFTQRAKQNQFIEGFDN